MRRLVLLACAALPLGFAPAPLPKPDTSKEDLKRMQGTWLHVSTESEVWGRYESGPALVISGDHMLFDWPSRPPAIVCTFRVDARQSPKALDMRLVRGVFGITPTRPTFRLATYSLEGDTLKVCEYICPRVEGRPKTVSAKRGATLSVFKRQRPRR